MIEYSITYTLQKKHYLDASFLNLIVHLINVANQTLKLKAKINYFDLVFVGDKKIYQLNEKYRNKARVTDVISLEYNPPFTIINKEMNHLGVVYIDFYQAKRQAKKYGHSLQREVCFLILHGLLHLVGYDHMQPQDEKVMFGLQDKILQLANINR